MRTRSKSDVLLTELIIAVLVFSVVAVIVVQMFAAARRKSAESGAMESALIAAQDMAERLSGEGDPAAVLQDAGFAREGERAFIRNQAEDGLVVKAHVPLQTWTDAGRLVPVTVSVWAEGAAGEAGAEPLVALPVLSYIPREEEQP